MIQPAFGIDYKSGDFTLARVTRPSEIAVLDLQRRFTTARGIVWWKTLLPGQLPDQPEPCMDINDLILDTGLISGLGASMEEIAMASPFVDNAQVTKLAATPDGEITAEMLITIKTGQVLSLTISTNTETGQPVFGFATLTAPGEAS